MKQKLIDPAEQGKLIKDPSSKDVHQDGEKKEETHNANGGKALASRGLEGQN